MFTRFAARLPAAVVAALLLQACATSAPPVEPFAGVDLPAQWGEPAPPGNVAAFQWWRAFRDATLAELIEAAYAANTDVAVAGANLRQARAAREQAASVLWPGVSASASAQRSRTPAASGRGVFGAGLDAAWELDLFGGNLHGVQAQEALVRASAAALVSTRVSVAAEVALAYVDLRAAQVRTAVARENLSSQEQTLQITQWRRQAGLTTSLDVEQAQGAAEQTRAQIPALQASAGQAAHALAVLTGRAPSALLATLSVPSVLPQHEGVPEVAIPAATLRQRPDVMAAEQRLRAAAAQVAQADAQRLPGVNLQASLSWSALTLGSLGSVSAARSLVASVAQPLFDRGGRDAVLAGRVAQFDAARENYRAQVLTALRDVEDALAALASARERLAALERALAAARNAALLATQRHAGGLIDFQTVLETQRTLLNVQDSVAGAQAALSSGHVRLYKALGGGWREARAEAPP